MDEIVAQLTDNLRQTVEAYQTVVAVEQNKQKHIVAGNAAEVLKTIEEGKPVADRIGALEAQRLELQAHLAQALHLDEPTTIRRIADALQGEPAEALRELRSQLIATIEELAKLHQSNTFLITRTLEVLDQVLAAVFDHLRQGVTYERSGERHRESSDGALLSRAL